MGVHLANIIIGLLMSSNQHKNISEGSDSLPFMRGDLLILEEGYNGAYTQVNRYVKGENTRTGIQGNIPTNMVHILPTVTKPSVEIMVNFLLLCFRLAFIL